MRLIICDEKAVEMAGQIDYEFAKFGDRKLSKVGVVKTFGGRLSERFVWGASAERGSAAI